MNGNYEIQVIYTLSTYEDFYISGISILCIFIQRGFSENICLVYGTVRVWVFE